ncbi:cytochrome P450 [Nocardioides stalactiti]|uniref:cytochrome P450 n=1 Tax=Nocardioides stalactiti TaxID=2755356 RepID=UPI00160150CF|nr:cytochrome P450 [Nocardioides stalactiti]
MSETDQLLASVLLDDHGAAGPYLGYDRIRTTAPVLIASSGTVVLSSWRACTQALRDPRLGKADESLGFQLNPVPPELQQTTLSRLRRTMLFQNPPHHTRLRRLVSDVFTPRHVADLEARVASTTDTLLDQIEERQGCDIVADLALPLPVAVIGDLLGVPSADRLVAAPLVRHLLIPLEPAADVAGMQAAARAEAQLADYFGDLLNEKRRRPTNDLLSRLATNRDTGALDQEECVGTAMLLFAAGFETTTNLIANGTAALLDHPDQADRWRRNPDLSLTAIDELLRFDAPIQTDGRTAMEATDLDGVPIAPGTMVLLLIGAANRDPARFEDPHRLDLGRPDSGSLAFGAGIHYCLGAPLARLEGRLLFPRLLARFPALRASAPARWRPGLTFRGLLELPVAT